MKIRESTRRATVWLAAGVAGAAVILALAVVAVGRGGAEGTGADAATGGSRAGGSPAPRTPGSPSAEAASPTASANRPHGTKKGQRAPSFSGVSTTGRKLHVPTGRITVLYFFAPGCYTCGPRLRRLADYRRGPHGHDIDMVGVNIDPPSEPVVEKFRRTYHATSVPVIKHADAALARRYHANYLGTTLVLDAEGTVRWRGSAPKQDELRRIVTRLRAAG